MSPLLGLGLVTAAMMIGANMRERWRTRRDGPPHIASTPPYKTMER